MFPTPSAGLQCAATGICPSKKEASSRAAARDFRPSGDRKERMSRLQLLLVAVLGLLLSCFQTTAAASKAIVPLPGWRQLANTETSDGNILCDFYNTMTTTSKSRLTNWCGAQWNPGNYTSTGRARGGACLCFLPAPTLLKINHPPPRNRNPRKIARCTHGDLPHFLPVCICLIDILNLRHSLIDQPKPLAGGPHDGRR